MYDNAAGPQVMMTRCARLVLADGKLGCIILISLNSQLLGCSTAALVLGMEKILATSLNYAAHAGEGEVAIYMRTIYSNIPVLRTIWYFPFLHHSPAFKLVAGML